MLHYLHSTARLCTISSRLRHPNALPSSPHPRFILRFRTAYREKLQYLKDLGIKYTSTNPPSHETVDQILIIINYLKQSQGFCDSEIVKLASCCPTLFSSDLDPTDISPVFEFLTADLAASSEESRGLVLLCPHILFSDVEYCLRPTLIYLKNLGLKGLNLPTNLNAHLLNTKISKLEKKVKFLRNIGFGKEQAEKVCARLPAVFGYSIENNLMPKFEYLVWGMGRSIAELEEFPQYFGFSLRKRIVPRHLHLKQRGVRISLKRMLLSGDQKFYSKWK
ncbi:hypothetical protein Nepgr_004594 [Nepenthes gracilis]|uniref:Transcription termination factor MTEF1, chloroplastic n=1 Tax=Nepenthes gracilis TaxID=150966 RepID=A0AAD3S1Q4_NEPGR|nr:hypothetical protein Nepgr_004594 [Nepenthes gracilis]